MSVEKRPILVTNVINPIKEFIQMETFSGLLLLFATCIALFLANGMFSDAYQTFWNSELTLGYGRYAFHQPLHFIINDFLMAIFFLLVGLEIKREALYGELSNIKQAILPIIAAVGGMIFPALLYLLFNHGQTARGWGIPVATDIAFAIGVMAILGKKVPFQLKVFLTALAIADDIGAVLIIAISYSSHIHWDYVLYSAVVVLILIFCNRRNFKSTGLYLLLGLVLWVVFLHTGFHATLAGVILAFCIPASPKISISNYIDITESNIKELKSIDTDNDSNDVLQTEQNTLLQMKENLIRVINPLQQLEHGLHPYVSYLIMPLFALANAGIVIHFDFSNPSTFKIMSGIIFGLVFGKMLGIFLFSWISIKLKIALRPENITWMQLLGVSTLGGIGFTMSIFVANLALPQMDLLNTAKLSVLIASLCAALLGSLILFLANRNKG